MELRNGRVRSTKTSKKMTPRVLPLSPSPPPLGRQCRSVSLAAATASPALCGSARGQNCTSPLKSPINQPYTLVTMLQVKPNCYPYRWNSHNGQTARSVRKPRILFTPQQSCYLEERFQEGQFPSIAARECMANLLELTPQQITIWFQNRRARTRRQSRRCKDDEPRTHMPKPPSFWPQHLPFDSNFIGVLNGDKGDKGTTGTPSSSSASESSKGESKPTSSPPEKAKSDDELFQEHVTPPSSTAESTASTSPLSSPMTATATHVGCSTMSLSPDNVSVSVSVLHRRHSSNEASTCNSLQHAYSPDTTPKSITTPNASVLAAHLLPSFSSICGNSYTSSHPVYRSVGYIPPQIPAPPPSTTTMHCGIGYVAPEQAAVPYYSTDHVPSAMSSCNVPPVPSVLPYFNNGYVLPKAATISHCSVGYMPSEQTATRSYYSTDCVPSVLVTTSSYHIQSSLSYSNAGSVPPKPTTHWSIGCVPPKPTAAGSSVGYVPSKPTAAIAHSSSNGYTATGISVDCIPPKSMANNNMDYVPHKATVVSVGHVPPKPATHNSVGYVPPKSATHNSVGYVPPKPATHNSVGYVPPKSATDIRVGHVPPKPAADICVGYVPPKSAANISVGHVPPKPATHDSVGYVPPKPADISVGHVPPKQATHNSVGYVPPKPATHNSVGNVPPKPANISVGYVPPKPTATMTQNSREHVPLRPTATTGSSITSYVPFKPAGTTDRKTGYVPFKATSLPSTACASSSQTIPSMESISSTALFLMSKSACASAVAGKPISHTSLPLSRPGTHPDTLTASIVTQPSTVNGTLTTFSHGGTTQSSSATKNRSISCSALERVEEVTALPSIDQFDLLDLPAAVDSTLQCQHDLMLLSPIHAEAPIPLVDILGEEWDLLDPILTAEYQETCLAPESSVHPPSDTNKSSFHCHQTAPVSVPTNNHIPLDGHALVENPITHTPSFTPQWHDVPLLPPENRHFSPARTHITISKPPLCYSNGPFQSSMAQYTNPFPPQFPNVRASVPPYALSSR